MQIRESLPAVMTDASLKFRRTKTGSEVTAEVLWPPEDELGLSPDPSEGTNRLEARRGSQTLTHCFVSASRCRRPHRHEALLFKRNGAPTPEPPAPPENPPTLFGICISDFQEAPPPTFKQMQTSASASESWRHWRDSPTFSVLLFKKTPCTVLNVHVVLVLY